MFKKTLIALAVASASTVALGAADIATNTVAKDVSIEGAASLTNVRADLIQIDMDAEYTVGDIITLTFAGGDLDITTAPASVNPVLADANDTMTLGLLSSSTSQLVYRVTELTLDGLLGETTIGATTSFAAESLEFTTASVLASGSVSVTYAAETSTGVAVDTPAGTDGTAEIFSTSNQFSVDSSTGFDAVIDVEADRLQYTDNTTIDAATITISSDTTLDYAVIDADDSYDLVVYGDFAYLDDDADTADVQLAANSSVTLLGASAGNGAPTTLTSTAATWEGLGLVASGDTVTVTIDSDGTLADSNADVVIPTQSFTYDLSVDYDDFGTDPAASGTAQASDTAAMATGDSIGEWTLNGSVVNVPYIPFGPNTQPIIRHTNIGSQTGDITVRYMQEGVDTTWQDLGTVLALAEPGVHNLLSEIQTALDAATGTDKYKVALEITTNVPADDVTVFVAAKITAEGQDRVTIGAFESN